MAAPIRVIGDAPQSLVDTNGHGTHVAGIIAGDGTESSTINSATNVPQGSVTNANFRGKAPAAMLYSVGGIEGGADTNFISDQYFQQVPALTNALISNNSWDYGDAAYDLAAASYDAAVRDALPAVTGSQPVLFVFAAGNSGGGGDSGGGGNADTILSPATAKDVITVGATEQLRNITNWVTALDGTSNQAWKAETDTGYQVAGYSSRGNVGIGVEGTFGRFKPDVVAPGTFVVSTRSEQWDTNAYYNPTNVTEQDYTLQTVTTNTWNYYSIDLSTIPNAVGVTLELFPNLLSPSPFNLPIYVATTPDPTIYPIPGSPGTYFSAMNIVTIPPNGPAGYLAGATASGGFNFAVGDNGTPPISYDLSTFIYTTNDLGNYFHVLQTQLNDPIGPWYRYETRDEHGDAVGIGRAGADAGLFHQPLAHAAQPGPAQGDAHQWRAQNGQLQFPGAEFDQLPGLGHGQFAECLATGPDQPVRGFLFGPDSGPKPDQCAGDRRQPDVFRFHYQCPGAGPAAAHHPGVDGPARGPRRRHQAREQPRAGRHQFQQFDQFGHLLRQRHRQLAIRSTRPKPRTNRRFLIPSTTFRMFISRR